MMSASESAPPHAPPTRFRRVRATVGGAVGQAIEFFDFTVYGFLAVYIGRTFFPSDDPSTELLSGFAVFGIAFLARPLGGFIFGPLSDRLGRKVVLVVSLALMSACSVVIGLLPGYATLGIAAPILLVAVRCLQGLSVAGEYASSSAYLMEYAASGRRAFGVSWSTVGVTSGLTFGIILVSVTTAALGTDVMASWGWRIPFLLAGPLGIFAYWIRIKLDDTPDFVEMTERGELDPTPVRSMFSNWRPIWLVVGVGALHAACFYAVFTYLPTYIGTVNSYGPTFALWATLVTAVVFMVALPLCANVADRLGRRPVLGFGSIGFGVLAYPVFWLITLGNAGLTLVAQAVLGLFAAVYLSASAVTMPELFPARIRGTGVAIGFNIPNAVFGGLMPFAATLLITQTALKPSPAFYLIGLSALAITTVLIMRRVDLHGDTASIGHRSGEPREANLSP
jgi:MHS family proline/betaine transporter-like MFS transporter